jgi:hypothetical protein
LKCVKFINSSFLILSAGPDEEGSQKPFIKPKLAQNRNAMKNCQVKKPVNGHIAHVIIKVDGPAKEPEDNECVPDDLQVDGDAGGCENAEIVQNGYIPEREAPEVEEDGVQRAEVVGVRYPEAEELVVEFVAHPQPCKPEYNLAPGETCHITNIKTPH